LEIERDRTARGRTLQQDPRRSYIYSVDAAVGTYGGGATPRVSGLLFPSTRPGRKEDGERRSGKAGVW